MQIPEMDKSRRLSIFRLMPLKVGRAIASPLVFCILVLVFYLAVEHVCQTRNRIGEYENFRDFPLMVLMSESGSGENYQADIRDAKYPYRIRRSGNRTTPSFLLPAGMSNPGVFRGDWVSYEVEQIAEDRQRITLYNWSRTMYVAWRRAVYEATADAVQPVSISGGTRGSHPLASLGIALLFAFFISRLGQYLACAATDASPRGSIQRLREAPWYEDPLSFLLVLPFLYYWWETLDLLPYNMADSYAYLWRRSFNWHFFTGRCLSQRIVFRYLCHSNLRIITAVQIVAFAASALVVYALLRRHVGLLVRLLLAVAIVFLFSSYTLNIYAIAIGSEPLFLAIAIVFPLVVFLWPHETRHWAVLAFGIFFIFSKNVGPFLTVGLVVLAVVSDAIHRRHFPALRMLAVYAVLGVFAIISMVITQKYDDAVDLNTFNNICQRILTDEEATAYFIEHYDMPDGDYIGQVRGGSTGSNIDGKRLYSVDSETMNFVMLHDRYGFVEWVQTDGRRAFVDYMFTVRPMDTLGELRGGYRRFLTEDMRLRSDDNSPRTPAALRRNMSADHMRYVISALGPRNFDSWPPDSNIARLMGDDEKRLVGFWGFDSIELMKDALLPLGIASFLLAFFYALAAIIAGSILRKAHWLPAGGGMLIFGLALFFLSFFGDSSVDVRHLFPGLVVITLGGWLTVIGTIELALRLAADFWRRRKQKASHAADETLEEEKGEDICIAPNPDAPISS